MAKYTVNCSDCGEEMTVELFGPHKDRDYKLANYTWRCDTCKETKLDAEGERAKAVNTEAGLPELTGSMKQINWAEQIRKKLVERKYSKGMVATYVSDKVRGDTDLAWMLTEDGKALGEDVQKALTKEVMISLFDECWADVCAKESAHWWITVREDLEQYIAGIMLKKMVAAIRPPIDETTKEAEKAKAEAMLVPADGHTVQAICTITMAEDGISLKLPAKVDAFRLMVKAAGFYWDNGRWFTGSKNLREQRAAWVGFNALALGIRVIVFDDAVRAAIESGNVKGRWITSNETHFFLRWWAGDWYDACKQLTGARWSKPFIKVPCEYADEVADFASAEDWGISPATRERIAAGLNTTTVAAEPPDPDPQPRPALKAKEFGVNDNLKD